MSNGWKGVISGFVATLVLSAIIVILNTLGILPQLDIVAHIDRLGSIQRVAAWVDHFIVGTLLWGPIFAGFDDAVENRPRWQKGLAFGVIAWVLMMVIFMPVVGGGLFGLNFGVIEPVGMLVLHLIYGLVLGVTYEALARRFPAKPLNVVHAAPKK